MAQPIAPEVWQEGIKDNRLLPNRYTNSGLFIGKLGVDIANNKEACRVWDMEISDYITDYDDRRLNGLGNIWTKSGSTWTPPSGYNADGRDGWGASAYGVFQDVRFSSRIYKMSRHRSCAMRVFQEMQREGGIGQWNITDGGELKTNGEALKAMAQQISEAKSLWEQEVLGPEIDKYNLFAVMNGHMSGRCVGKIVTDPSTGAIIENHNDHIFDGDCRHYEWVPEPGPTTSVQEVIQPNFAPIHCIEFDNDNIPRMLQTVKATWNNLFIPPDNRCIIIDNMYEYEFLSVLTGQGIVTTESAYKDLQNGSFTRLMGWDFRFDIPTQYFPTLWVDDNLNVVHSEDGQAAYDKIINSIDGKNLDGEKDVYTLQRQLVASQRMSMLNYIRTEWDTTNKKFVKKLTNYPLGQPAAAPWMGEAIEFPSDGVEQRFREPGTYPWMGPGSGYGLDEYDSTVTPRPNYMATGPQLTEDPSTHIKSATAVKVMGCFIYKKAAQLSQEYSEMLTKEGETRGKFIEMVTDVKYDAWTIERLSHGILPIVNTMPDASGMGIPVSVSPIELKTTEPIDVNAEAHITNEDTDPVNIAGDVNAEAHVTNTVSDPVNTKEATATNKKKA